LRIAIKRLPPSSPASAQPNNGTTSSVSPPSLTRSVTACYINATKLN
jgi:hypothetical protein